MENYSLTEGNCNFLFMNIALRSVDLHATSFVQHIDVLVWLVCGYHSFAMVLTLKHTSVDDGPRRTRSGSLVDADRLAAAYH
jgi:hypothetical protein